MLSTLCPVERQRLSPALKGKSTTEAHRPHLCKKKKGGGGWETESRDQYFTGLKVLLDRWCQQLSEYIKFNTAKGKKQFMDSRHPKALTVYALKHKCEKYLWQKKVEKNSNHGAWAKMNLLHVALFNQILPGTMEPEKWNFKVHLAHSHLHFHCIRKKPYD